MQDATESTAAAQEVNPIEFTITLMIGYTFPKLQGKVRVERRPRAPYLYHVKRLINNVHSPDECTILVRTAIQMNSPRDVEAVKSISRACLEILEGRSHAVAYREGR